MTEPRVFAQPRPWSEIARAQLPSALHWCDGGTPRARARNATAGSLIVSSAESYLKLAGG